MISIGKQAKKNPKKNLFNKNLIFSSASDGMAVSSVVENNGLRVTSTSGTESAVAYVYNMIPIRLKKGKTYTISAIKASLTNTVSKIRVAYLVNGGKVTVANDVKSIGYLMSTKYTFTVADGQEDIILGFYSKDNSETGVNICTYDDVQLEEGSVATSFEPYEEIDKDSTKVHKKNLIKPFGDPDYYFPAVSIGKYTVVNPSRIELNATADHQYFRIPFPVKPNTVYTISAKHNGKIGIYTDDGASGIVGYDTVQKATFNSGNRTVLRFYFSNIGMGTGNFYLENIQLEEGSDATSFEPYQKGSKQANLVPKKNLLTGFKTFVPNNFTLVSMEGDWKVTYKANNVTFPNGYFLVNVKPNTDYTFSMDMDSDMLIGIFNADASVVQYNYTVGNSMTFNSKNNSKLRLYLRQPTANKEFTLSNPMFAEGAKQDFEPFELIVKKPAQSIKKAPYRNYPFTFTRQSVESLSSVQYGMNNPRIKNNGIFIEEGTVNSFSTNGVNDLSTWSAQQVTVSGDLFTENTVSAIHRVTRAVSGVSGNQYTLSVLLKDNGRRYVYFNADAVMGAKSTIDLQTGEVIVGKGTASSQYVGDGWYRFSITGTWGSGSMIFLQLNNNFVATDTTHVGNGLSGVYAKDFQFEQKAYPTSYTPKERKNELLYLPSTTSVIDYTKGSIAVDFSYEDVALAMTQTNFMFDTSGTRIFANYDKNLSKFQVSMQGLALLQAPPSVMKNDNKLLIEWDNRVLTATINDYVMTYTNPSSTLNAGIGLMSIGVRFSLNQNWINGTINSFVVKDRNDKITFQI